MFEYNENQSVQTSWRLNFQYIINKKTSLNISAY